jgi:hypothetical protein
VRKSCAPGLAACAEFARLAGEVWVAVCRARMGNPEGVACMSASVVELEDARVSDRSLLRSLADFVRA